LENAKSLINENEESKSGERPSRRRYMMG